MKKTYKIQDLVEIFGLTTRTLRFWEEKDLLNALLRVPGKRRVYGEDVIKRIKDIKSYKSRGLSLEDIKIQIEKKEKKSKVKKNPIRIIVGSSAGIEEVNMTKYEIDLLPSYIFLDGRKFVDGVNISEKEIADLEWIDLTTQAPSVDDYIYIYSEMVEEGVEQIISFHPNKTYCDSIVNAKKAADRVKGIKIHIIDTCSFGQISELLAIITRDRLNKGALVEQVIKYLLQLIADHASYLVVSSMINMSNLGLVNIEFKKIVNPLFRATMNYHPLLKMNNQIDAYELISRAGSLIDGVDDLVAQIKNEEAKSKFPIKMVGVYYTCNKTQLNELVLYFRDQGISVFWQKSNFYMSAHLGTESVAVNILYER
ncbi:MAG: DegV family protein [Candidatus Margulisbacteria bacterium]|nr:DegV family protein [Candidatus Margulisiibacteriota bacterium]